MLTSTAACAVILAGILLYLGLDAAYRRGVVAGYGYSLDPEHPRYRRAAAALLRSMAPKWPALAAALTKANMQREATDESHDNADQGG